MTARPRRSAARLDLTLMVLGALALVVIAAVGYVSFTANSGLPWQRTYDVTVEVPDANRLIATSDVRVGGVRVGQVETVEAVSGGDGQGARARLKLALDRDLRPLRSDTVVQVRPASVLGATYLELDPGRGGRALADGEVLPATRVTSSVELTDLLDVFDRGAARSFRGAIRGSAEGLAGRGRALNATLGSFAELLAPLTHVARHVASPRARLPRFIATYNDLVGALAPVRRELAGVFSGGARTFGALAREHAGLEAAIEAAPAAESATARAFRALRPGLESLARVAVALEPAGPLLPGAIRETDAMLGAGVRPLARVPAFARRLSAALEALRVLSRDPATSSSLRKLHDAARSTNESLEVLLPAQEHCNVIGMWGQSFANVFSGLGTGRGPSLASLIITTNGARGEVLQNARPSSNVGINPIPNENADECESGNEPWEGKQLLNNPPGLQSRQTRESHPPPGTRDRAREAGLLDDPEPAR